MESDIVAQEDHTTRGELSDQQTSVFIWHALRIGGTVIQENLSTIRRINDQIISEVEFGQVDVHVFLCEGIVVAWTGTNRQPRVILQLWECAVETGVDVSTEVSS